MECTSFFIIFSQKSILVFRYSPKSIGFFHSGSSIAVSNMYLIRALMSLLRETQPLACSGGGGDLLQTKTIISPKFQISGYNYSQDDKNLVKKLVMRSKVCQDVKKCVMLSKRSWRQNFRYDVNKCNVRHEVK